MTLKQFLALCLFLFIPLTVNAQMQSGKASHGATGKKENKSDEAEIRQLLDNWAKAFKVGDMKGIMAMYAPEVVAFDLVPPLQYVGKEAYQKDYEEFLAQYEGGVAIEFRDLHIFVSGDLAFATCLEQVSGTLKNGQKSVLWVRATSSFRKINGRWLDIHDHISVPTDLITGKAVLDLKP